LSRFRSRLPEGFIGYRSDLGQVIRQKRDGEVIKQQTLADTVGIRRETLSQIECGRTWPQPDTIDGLMRALGLDWPDVAEPGPLRRSVRRPVDGSWRDEQLRDVGALIRKGRKAKDLTLREAAELVGLSAAQLSRLERGECVRSQVWELVPGQGGVEWEDADLQLANGALSALIIAPKPGRAGNG
jgi:transcriptional regulator with XRE-family HTH domain